MRKNINPTEPKVEVVLEPTAVPISVVTLALELGDITVAELVARLGPDVFVEPSSGLRCVDVVVCRRVIDEAKASAAWRAKASADAEARILASLPKPTRFVTDEHFQEIASPGFKAARR